MPELDDSALELRLRTVLTERLGSLPLDLTAEELERRRRARIRARGGRRPLIILGLAAALLVPVGWLAAGAPLPLETVPDVTLRPAVVPIASPAALSTPTAASSNGPTVSEFFVPPFEFVIPVDSGIRPTVPGREMMAWVAGADVSPSPAPEYVNPDAQPAPSNVRGIIVGSGEEAWSHGSNGRFMLRTGPAEFLADLRDTAGVQMSAISETMIDGRPALTVMLPGNGGSDIHVAGRTQGLASGRFVLVTIPSRLIVVEIADTTVFILVWARTADDLAAWMPVADAFVASIHFLPEAQS